MEYIKSASFQKVAQFIKQVL